LNSFYT